MKNIVIVELTDIDEFYEEMNRILNDVLYDKELVDIKYSTCVNKNTIHYSAMIIFTL